MIHLFVYYKLDSTEVPSLLTALSNILIEVQEKHPSIITKILKRPNLGSDGKETWMETYVLDENLEQSLTKLLDMLVIKYNLTFNRHYELFKEC
ncbi:MAG: DUF4936 family protein [Burkholderiales bacterium]|nr:DUF4936 family protein [Burkholderiales bacterium]